MKETEEGRFYVKNMTIKLINLARNSIGDSGMGAMKKFAEAQGKEVQIFLEGNKLTKKGKESLKVFENILL